MGSIEEEGFLSEDLAHYISKVRNDFPDWFTLCDDISKFSQQILLLVENTQKNFIELSATILFVRALSNFQGIIIMAERGMVNEARIIARCLAECMYIIVAIDKDNEFADIYISDYLYKHRTQLKAMKRMKESGILPGIQLESNEIEERIQNVTKDIENNSVKRLPKIDIAKKAEMTVHYETVYSGLSDTVHVSVTDLQQYLDIGEDNIVQQILWGPDVEGIELILFTAVEALLYVLVALKKILNLNYKDPYQKIVDQYNKLGLPLMETER